MSPPCVLFRSACCNRKKMGGGDGPPPLCSFSQCLLQQEEDGGRRWPTPLVFFFAVLAATGRRWAAAMAHPPCVLFRSACCNRKKMGGGDAPPYVFFRVFAAWGAKHPLTSFVWRWFHLSFCAPFLALHSYARNHATRFSMLFSSSKRLKNHSIVSSAPLFWAHILNCRHRNRTHNLPCRKCSTNHWHTISLSAIEERGLFF